MSSPGTVPGGTGAPRHLLLATLALAEWQCGDGALASVVLHRARDADPGYAMVLILSRSSNWTAFPWRPALSGALRPGEYRMCCLYYLEEVLLPSVVAFCF